MNKKGNLIIFLNRRCPVGCASCNVGATARQEEERAPAWLEKFFQRTDDLTFSGYVLWTGGEPFLSLQSLEKGIGLAQSRGYTSEILTSGCWYTSRNSSLQRLLSAVAPAGMLTRKNGTGGFSIRISVDAEHRDSVPLERVMALAKSALELNIETNFTLREIPGRGDFLPEFLEVVKGELPEFYERNHCRSRWLHYLPHIPIEAGGACGSCGIGKDEGNGKEREKGRWRSPCKLGFRDIVVGADGLVYPCCGFFSIPGFANLAVGDPLVDSWEALGQRYTKKTLFRVLKEKGPYGICRQLKLSPETWGWPVFEAPCQLCLALFREYGDQVFRQFE